MEPHETQAVRRKGQMTVSGESASANPSPPLKSGALPNGGALGEMTRGSQPSAVSHYARRHSLSAA
ncbi:hypothetical protein CBOM_01106 [Ceraceosorus bombacis]|uniref:Uncharacterized protein n=1 Tax=Ceraceosorus bombacis TaxID=401625 RepID=A0A0P1BBQ3_9BASI|nr:hypothetical protein CBOM_01106 [Ceraceosorus bombacis]